MAKEKKESKNQKGNYTNLLLERMEKKIDHVLEGHAVLEKEIKDFRHEMRGEMNEFRFEIRTELKFLKSASHSLEETSKVIKEYLKHIDDEIQFLKKAFTQKADLDRVIALEKRVTEIQMAVEKNYGKNSN